MIASRSALTLAAMAITVVAAACVSPALASCDNRPGTPTDISLEPQEGAINIKWRDTTHPGEGSCHDIEVKRTQNGDTSKSVTGGVCLTGGTAGNFVVNNIGYGQAYCVRLKARDRAGTQGCVSQNWSAQVCGSSGSPPLINTKGGGGGGAPTKEFEPGINRANNDYRDFPLPSANASLCQAACKQDNKCVAWTYVNPKLQGPAAHCWLKNAVPPATADSCCTSGVPDKFIQPK